MTDEKIGKNVPMMNVYICERCDYRYMRVIDYPPHLCFRCMTYISKRIFTMVRTIQPMKSRSEVGEV